MSDIKPMDLTGHKYGKLLVVGLNGYRYSTSGRKVYLWNCKCDCGNDAVVESKSLRSGNSKSCGCLAMEHTIKMGHDNKKYNDYDLSGDYGVGYLSCGDTFMFDMEDYYKIKDFYWYKQNGYILANAVNKRGRSVFIHRIILGLNGSNKEKQVDHINHDTYDNRKNNLRIVNNSKNQMNTRATKNNTTGCKGVYLEKQTNKYRASITKDKQVYKSKRFVNMQDAIQWRKEIEEQLFGEYSYEKSIRRNIG